MCKKSEYDACLKRLALTGVEQYLKGVSSNKINALKAAEGSANKGSPASQAQLEAEIDQVRQVSTEVLKILKQPATSNTTEGSTGDSTDGGFLPWAFDS